MIDLDKTLQEELEALERGVPLEKVLADLPDEAAELAPILKLASGTQKIRHPELNAEASHFQRARVLAAAKARQAPSRPASRWASIPASLSSRRGLYVLAAGLAFIFLCAFGTVGIGFYLTGPVSAHSAQTIDVNGLVEVSSSPNASDWRFISNGDQLHQGEHIRTYAGSSATLVFFDGSRTVIGPGADLTLNQLNGGWGNVLQVEMTQNSGATDQSVVPLRGSGAFFRVLTPSGEAIVHGTSFNVNVTSTGEALFTVNHGRVQVKNTRSEVFLTAGQATAVRADGDPEHPGYRFSLQGQVTALSDSHWVVAGVPFDVSPRTEIIGTFVVNNFVFVRGRILESGVWAADLVEPANQDATKLKFTGELTSKDGDAWTIGGKAVMVNSETELNGDLKTGTAVEVSFVVVAPGNTWLAKEIDALDEEGEGPTPTGTVTATGEGTSTPTPTATATVTGTPGTSTPTATETVTGTPGTATPTTTPTVTGTPGTTTPTPTSIGTSTPETGSCSNRTQPQPEGMRLAQRFNVPYEEIMGWFCQGYGFGEIDLAYGLSLQTGKPVTEIFAMRKSGMGWGQIKQQLSRQITITPNPGKKGKGPNK